jgi:hypothetical protein
MQLSENLSLKEVVKSNTATRRGIDNSPTPEHLENLKALAKNVFQPLRDALGIITVSSGYRSFDLNKAIGGSKTSQHCKGEALDLDNDFKKGRSTNKEIFDYIKDNLTFDQMIFEFGTETNPNWVHVSYKSNGMNRGQILRAIKVKGRTKYLPYKE